MVKVSESVRPILRWAGSKRKLVPKLSQYWNIRANRYIEPFFGSGALYFYLCPPSAILSDLNAELIDMYITLRDETDIIFRELSAIEPSKEIYNELRSKSPSQLTSVERCVRFLYLNRYCFNGLFRTNRAGNFNVPYSGDRTGALPSKAEFQAVVNQIKKAKIVSGDFEEIVRGNAKSGDFVYLDPPYAVSNVRIFKQYGPDVFGVDDLHRVNKLLRELEKKQIDFVLSYASCEEADEIFSEWSMDSIDVRRNIAGFAKHRKSVPEAIYTNTKRCCNSVVGEI